MLYLDLYVMLLTWHFYIWYYLSFFYGLTSIMGWHKMLYIKLKHSLLFGLKASFSVVRYALSLFSSHPIFPSPPILPSHPSIYRASQYIYLPLHACLSWIYSCPFVSSYPTYSNIKHWVMPFWFFIRTSLDNVNGSIGFLIQLLNHVKSFEEISTKDFKTIQMVKKDGSD